MPSVLPDAASDPVGLPFAGIGDATAAAVDVGASVAAGIALIAVAAWHLHELTALRDRRRATLGALAVALSPREAGRLGPGGHGDPVREAVDALHALWRRAIVGVALVAAAVPASALLLASGFGIPAFTPIGALLAASPLAGAVLVAAPGRCGALPVRLASSLARRDVVRALRAVGARPGDRPPR